MKKVKITAEFLVMMLTKGNKINYEIINGLDKHDTIVGCDYNEFSKTIDFWVDNKKIEIVEIEAKRLEEE